MNNLVKKLISALLAATFAVSMSAIVFADETENAENETAVEFIDMPDADDWRTEALKNAVANGLISGVGGGKIAPDAPIDRSQMAAIIVRAFGASEKADISMYGDIPTDPKPWYYDELAKAVQMGAFSGDGKNMMPDKKITFQECFTVLSRVFALDMALLTEEQVPYYQNKYPGMLCATENDLKNSLVLYSDANEVADWAKLYYGSIVYGGYWSGGKDMLLKPTEYITRGEFAVVMNNLVKAYITEPGAVSELPEGNVVIKSDDVVLDGITHKGDIIISDCVGANKITINDVDVDGRIVFRGCATPGEVEVKDSNGNVIETKTSFTSIGCTLTGRADWVVLAMPYIHVDPSKMVTVAWAPPGTASVIPSPSVS